MRGDAGVSCRVDEEEEGNCRALTDAEEDDDDEEVLYSAVLLLIFVRFLNLWLIHVRFGTLQQRETILFFAAVKSSIGCAIPLLRLRDPVIPAAIIAIYHSMRRECLPAFRELAVNIVPRISIPQVVFKN